MEERDQLAKTLKPQWVWAIALGSAIGWGAFVQPTVWMSGSGPLGAIIGFGIGAVLMMIIAVSYGFLIEHFPVSGGEFAYAFLGFNRNHAYVAGWFLVLGYICIVALNASALSLVIKYIFPAIAEQGYMYSVAGWDVYFAEVVITSVALIVFAFMNVRGSTVSGQLQYIFVICMLVGVGILFVGSVFHPSTSISGMQPLFKPDVSIWSSVIVIVAIAPWAFVGFDNIPQAAEEFDFSPKKGFMLIILSLLFAGLVYIFMITATAIAAPWQNMTNLQWGTGDAMSGLFGKFGILILAVALTMGVCTGLNGFYVASSRLLFAMGRAKIIPSVFAKLHPTHRTPYAGIIFTCAVCLISPWFGRQVLTWIVDMSSVGVTIAYIYTCIVAFKLFKWSNESSLIDQYRTLPSVAAPVKKMLSLFGALIGFVFLGLLLIPASPAFMGVPSLIALAIWIVVGTGFFIFKGPGFNKIEYKQLEHLILGTNGEDEDAEASSS
ncbi:APC family permease [Lentibacillus cibarius]|uniref:APC family permease n=1 Tax=Lentibacillus cibarius TaxID=2583219 RepID=A0A549YEY2_9BACI|nr:APC family permease [Lentibacillus cibarius]TMN21542.1 APC family permease [Lentibacillus cibarius]TRM10442.1 APC family permease [Lentibacillus cibarius]